MKTILERIRRVLYEPSEEENIDRASRVRSGIMLTATNSLEHTITKGNQYVVKSVSVVREEETCQPKEVLYKIIDDSLNTNQVSYRNFKGY